MNFFLYFSSSFFCDVFEFYGHISNPDKDTRYCLAKMSSILHLMAKWFFEWSRKCQKLFCNMDVYLKKVFILWSITTRFYMWSECRKPLWDYQQISLGRLSFFCRLLSIYYYLLYIEIISSKTSGYGMAFVQ